MGNGLLGYEGHGFGQDSNDSKIVFELSEPRVESGSSHARKRVAATILVAHAAKHVYNSGQSSLIMPEIKIGLQINRAQFGSLQTASSIAWWLSTMVSGYLGDRFSNRAGLMIATSLALMGMSLFVVGYAPNYGIMLVAMFFVGIGPSMFHPPALGELSRRFPERRGFAVSLHGMGANIGEVLGAPVVALLLVFLTWRDLLKISLLPALVLAIAVWMLIPSRKPTIVGEMSSTNQYIDSLINLMKDRVLLVLIIATALRSIGEGAAGGFLSLYLRDDLEYSVTTVALILSLSQVAGIISQPVMGYLSDRIGRKPVLVSGTALTMLSAFALGLVRPGIPLFLVVLVKGAFSFSLHHIFVAAALDTTRGVAQSTVVSLIYGAGLIGTVSPYLAGLIADRYGIQSAFLFGGVVLIIPTILLMVARFSSPEQVRRGRLPK